MASKVGEKIKSVLAFNKLIGMMLIAGSVTYMFLLSDPKFNNRCYISEKALSPGVIEEQFNQINVINDYYSEVKKLSTVKNLESGKFQKWLEEELVKIGLDAYTQNFTFNYPLILGGKKLHGINTVGISRAYRAARTEALVLMAPLRGLDAGSGVDRQTAGSVALMLALAKFFRSQTHWAKDTIFLFTEMELVGLQAWLHAYHGEAALLRPAITVAEPLHRSGSIQAALCLELASPTDWQRPRIHIEGVNGVLPNLDLVNTAVRIAGKHGVRLRLHGSDRQPALLLRSLLYQASGSPASLHGLFLPFDIPAIGLSGTAGGGGGSSSTTSVWPRTGGAIVEGIWRSLNNLQERLHQSFFFYALPAIDRYVSIGDYMPPLGAVLLALALAAVHSLADGFGGDGEGDGDADANKSTKKASSLASAMSPVLRLAAVAWCFGLLAWLAPAHLIGAAASFRIDPGAGTMTGLLAIQAMAAAFPRLFPAMLTACHPGALRLFACLALGVSLGALSMVNFGLAFLAACPMASMCLLAGGPGRVPWPARAGLGLLALAAASPAGLLLGGCWAGLNFAPGGLAAAWTCAEYASLQGYIEGQLLGGLTYRLVCLLLLPCWLLAWCQLFACGGGGGPSDASEAEKKKDAEAEAAKTEAEKKTE